MTNFDNVHNNPDHFNNHEFAPKQPKRRKKWKWFVLILVLLVVFSIGFKFFNKTNQIFTGDKNWFGRISDLLSADKKLIGEEENGSVNILLLGVGGPGHEGPLLTD